MKTTTMLAAVLCGSALSVMAQGTINFASTSASDVARINGVLVTSANGGATFALYWASTGTVGTEVDSLFVQIGATATAAANGFVSGGTRTTGVATPAGTVGFFQVRAWQGNFLTYEEAIIGGALTDKTLIFSNGTGNPGGAPPTNPAGMAGWNEGLALVAVPEPSTIALAGLGAASLLFLRRRK